MAASNGAMANVANVPSIITLGGYNSLSHPMVPKFNRQAPRAWFCKFEALMQAYGVAPEIQYAHLQASLPPEIMVTCKDAGR